MIDEHGSLREVNMRSKLKAGNIYTYPGNRHNRFKINTMSLPDTPSDDGGAPGVSVTWLSRPGSRSGKTFWYPAWSEEEFWNLFLFKDAVDAQG
jgi:hypothetical protein